MGAAEASLNDLKTQVDSLSTSVNSYGSCQTEIVNVVDDVSDVESKLDTLIAKLQEDGQLAWQKTYDDFNANGFDCTYIPQQYCTGIVTVDKGQIVNPCQLILNFGTGIT